MALFDQIELLLIEDDPSVASLMVEVLINQKPTPNWPITYRIQQADTLKTALRYAGGGAWDMIILDLGLPDSQGLETFNKLKAVAKAPILVFTGAADFDLIESVYAAGAKRCYSKSDLSRCMHLLHYIIMNCVREWIMQGRLNYMEDARFNRLRDLESACAECGRWRDPSTNEWLTPAVFLERRGINLSHTVCPDDQVKLYGHLKEK